MEEGGRRKRNKVMRVERSQGLETRWGVIKTLLGHKFGRQAHRQHAWPEKKHSMHGNGISNKYLHYCSQCVYMHTTIPNMTVLHMLYCNTIAYSVAYYNWIFLIGPFCCVGYADISRASGAFHGHVNSAFKTALLPLASPVAPENALSHPEDARFSPSLQAII